MISTMINKALGRDYQKVIYTIHPIEKALKSDLLISGIPPLVKMEAITLHRSYIYRNSLFQPLSYKQKNKIEIL